jgi:hypothetical protein
MDILQDLRWKSEDDTRLDLFARSGDVLAHADTRHHIFTK